VLPIKHIFVDDESTYPNKKSVSLDFCHGFVAEPIASGVENRKLLNRFAVSGNDGRQRMKRKHYGIKQVLFIYQLQRNIVSNAFCIADEGGSCSKNTHLKSDLVNSAVLKRQIKVFQVNSESRSLFADKKLNVVLSGFGAYFRGLSGVFGFYGLIPNSYKRSDADDYKRPFRGCIPAWRFVLGALFLFGGCFVIYRDRTWSLFCGVNP
jgi:hypothetical protein